MQRVFGSLLLLGVCLIGLMNSASSLAQALSKDDLDREYAKTSGERRKLYTGEKVPQGKEDDKIMEITARYFIDRVKYDHFKVSSKEMEKVHKELEEQLIANLLAPSTAKANRVFVDKLGKHMADRFKEVLSLDFAGNRITVINAALMLPPVARLKQEDIGDLLAQILKDPKAHDAVKVYAAKAMGEFFPADIMPAGDKGKDPKVKKKFERDMSRLGALVSFIERKEPATTDPGEHDAFIYIRREAIISLAKIGVPALAAIKSKGMVEGPAAYDLLHILLKGKGALDPPATLAERVEAALGLCQIKDTVDVEYDPSVAVYAVGLCFLDYALDYSSDYANLSGRKNLKNIDPNSKIPTMHWRILSERWMQGVKDLAQSARETPAKANAPKLEKGTSKIAEAMGKYESIQNDLQPLRQMVESLKPKTGQLYTKLKGPQIDLDSLKAAPAAE
jgi:hypothetical protein